MAVLLVYVTFPDGEIARQIGSGLVAEQLAACVNLCPGVTSIYRWQGEVESAEEVLAIFKTDRACYPALQQAIKRQHPYEVPEIIAVEVAEGSPEYLQWLGGQLRS
jgi:periplasmic divalent cation tolerance protein